MTKRSFWTDGKNVTIHYNLMSRIWYDKTGMLKEEYTTKWTVLINGKFASKEQMASLGSYKSKGEYVPFTLPKSKKVTVRSGMQLMDKIENQTPNQIMALMSSTTTYRAKTEDERTAGRESVFYIMHDMFNLSNADLQYLKDALVGNPSKGIEPWLNNDDFDTFYMRYQKEIEAVYKYESYVDSVGNQDQTKKKVVASEVMSSLRAFLKKRGYESPPNQGMG